MKSLKNILENFKLINELKLDRFIIGDSSYLSNIINFPHLNKLTIYTTNEKIPLNVNFLNLSSMYNLRYIRIPQVSLPDYSQMPKNLETLVLTECRDLHFDFIHNYEKLRLLKLYLNNFDRLLENNGELIMNLIHFIFNNNKIIETLQLMCHGISQSKLKTFEKHFNLNNIHYLYLNYDRKSLTIQRSDDYFHKFI